MAKNSAEQYGEPQQVLDWLEDRRKRADLTQSEIEARTKAMGARISQAYYSQLKNGVKKLADLSPERMDALRSVLGISPEEWVQRTGYEVIRKYPENSNGMVTGLGDSITEIVNSKDKVIPIALESYPAYYIRSLEVATLDDVEPYPGLVAPVWPQQKRPGLKIFFEQIHHRYWSYMYYVDTEKTNPEIGKTYLVIDENPRISTSEEENIIYRPFIATRETFKIGDSDILMFPGGRKNYIPADQLLIVGEVFSQLKVDFDGLPLADPPEVP